MDILVCALKAFINEQTMLITGVGDAVMMSLEILTRGPVSFSPETTYFDPVTGTRHLIPGMRGMVQGPNSGDNSSKKMGEGLTIPFPG